MEDAKEDLILRAWAVAAAAVTTRIDSKRFSWAKPMIEPPKPQKVTRTTASISRSAVTPSSSSLWMADGVVVGGGGCMGVGELMVDVVRKSKMTIMIIDVVLLKRVLALSCLARKKGDVRWTDEERATHHFFDFFIFSLSSSSSDF